MSLQSLITKKSLNVLGINSGTSADGLDFALLKIADSGRRAPGVRARQLLTGFSRYTPEVRDITLRLADSQKISLDELALADEALGEFIGRRARSFIKRCVRHGLRVDCIASHGQTVRHHPQIENVAGARVRATLQIGSPERISAQTGLVCLSHFRQADTAIGGEGAPITTGAVNAVTGHPNKSRLILNLGGIANYFYVPSYKTKSEPFAEDVGPANVLLDQAVQRLFGLSFDKGGKKSSEGTVSAILLNKTLQALNREEKESQVLSTGREKYSPEIVKKILSSAKRQGLRPADTLATISQATAEIITTGLSRIIKTDPNISELYITGGGLRNKDLVGRLRLKLQDLSIVSISGLGFSPDHFEALCFAVLGYYCLRGKSAQTGHKKSSAIIKPIPGRICQPPAK